MIADFLRRFAARSFVRNVAVLSSANAVAQGLAIAASPILTRLFDPSAFGSFGLLTSLSGTLIVISGLRYELAVVTARDDAEAANVLALTCGIVLLASGLTVALVASLGPWIAVRMDLPELAALLWWLPILVFVGGVHQAITFWSTRRQHYKRLAISKVTQSVSVIGSQITAGIQSLGVAGLIGGRTLGHVIATGLLGFLMGRQDRVLIKSSVSFPEILKVARENSRFPKYNAPQNLLSSLSKTFVPYLLASFFGLEIVGFYYLAERVMRTPSALVSDSVRRVYLQRASELHNQGRSLFRLLFKTCAGLFAIGILPLVLLLFFAPEIFSFVFGSNWHTAGVLAQWLVNWWILAFIAGPAVETLTVLKLQKYLLLFQIAFSLSRILSIVVGAMIGDDITAIAAYSLVGFAFNLALILSALFVARRTSQSSGQGANK